MPRASGCLNGGALVVAALIAQPGFAQEMGAMPMAHEPAAESSMSSVLGVPRARWSSGTSWLPDATPMSGWMLSAGGWHLMLHENVFVDGTWNGSDRGGEAVRSVNWVMGMASHALGPGELTARAMLSAEPLTVGLEGYPLLLQTGESAHGVPLHDRQHPHDLLMELALRSLTPLASDLGLELYAAAAGEPALGPTAFPHRPSALFDPLAPIGHHWQDSTHISFGVLTAGLFTRRVKLEGSWFNGREPDENRWNLDLRVPDSFSARLTVNPNEAWSLQASYGFLRSPEATEPDVSVHRLTASATSQLHAGAASELATTLLFGANATEGGAFQPSVLIESAWTIDARSTVFGRAEWVRKSAAELVLPGSDAALFDVGLLGAGYVYSFIGWSGLVPGVGVRGSLGLVDPEAAGAYGTRVPLGATVFLQLRPAPMSM